MSSDTITLELDKYESGVVFHSLKDKRNQMLKEGKDTELTVLYTIVIFADEHRYGTIYQLEIIPVSSRKFVLAKLVVIAFLAL